MHYTRKTNSILNSIFGTMSYVFVMIATMTTRIFFARYLGEELLGLNSLYTSVLQILQITEMGIESAMIVFLYKPFRDRDKETAKSIIGLYRKVYSLFAIFLLLVGILVQISIIPNIVKMDKTNIKTIQVYFFMCLLGVVCSYVFAYYKSIFYAEQKNRRVSLINSLQKVLVCIFQVIVIIKFQSYFIYLCLIIFGNCLENIICRFWVIKEHPYLIEKKYTKLDKIQKEKIVDVIKPIFIVKIADKVLGQTDSILINTFLSITTLGIYSNYHTIFNACIGLFSPIGAALTSSYGNLAITGDSKMRFNAYRRSYCAFHTIAVLFCGLFFCFIQDFIRVFYGNKFILPQDTIVFMTIYLYIYFIGAIYYSYQNALGLQKLDQKQIILQAILNILLSIILVYMIGLNGIIIGTIISLFICSVGYKGYIIYKKIFEIDTKLYFKRTVIDIIVSGVVIFLEYIISNNFYVDSLTKLIIKGIILGTIITVFTGCVFLYNTEYREIVKSLLKRV